MATGTRAVVRAGARRCSPEGAKGAGGPNISSAGNAVAARSSGSPSGPRADGDTVLHREMRGFAPNGSQNRRPNGSHGRRPRPARLRTHLVAGARAQGPADP